jgi:hypothetical protein
MSVRQRIAEYIAAQPASKRSQMQELHNMFREIRPESKLWFLDGRDEAGKVVTNPNIGYGTQMMKYADGSTREFYRVGLSANTSGLSVYIMGLDDKKYLSAAYAKGLGKATVTGYCIKFRKLSDIDTDVLRDAVRFGLERAA